MNENINRDRLNSESNATIDSLEVLDINDIDNNTESVCSHYEKGCKLVATCCNKVVHCHICHDESQDHEMNRYDIKEIICNECNKIQKPSLSCEECHLQFGKYYCKKCNLWENKDPEYNCIFHCNKCGICRKVSSNEDKTDYYHCDECNCCMHLKMKNNHKCIKDKLNIDCCLCLEYIFKSRKASTTLQCNHTLHIECIHNLLKNGKISCPLCRKTMLDKTNLELYNNEMDTIIKNNPINEEIIKEIKCNDCNEKSNVLFHPFGMKCGNCGNYNVFTI